MCGFRTDLAMERAGLTDAETRGVRIEQEQEDGMQMARVTIESEEAARDLGKACGVYWTLTHPQLAELLPQERVTVAERIARELRRLLPKEGSVLVLGLGNRRLTADALGDRVVSGVLVTRHLREEGLRSVCALAPGVMGVTGVETAELCAALTQRLKVAAVIAVDALAAMETAHVCTTVQVTDTGIHPGSGVGNHRAGIDAQSLHVPVIALGVPTVVYTSTIVRDSLKTILQKEQGPDDAEAMAGELAANLREERIVTTRDIDQTVQSLGDMLALAINAALQPACTMEELTMLLH